MTLTAIIHPASRAILSVILKPFPNSLGNQLDDLPQGGVNYLRRAREGAIMHLDFLCACRLPAGRSGDRIFLRFFGIDAFRPYAE